MFDLKLTMVLSNMYTGIFFSFLMQISISCLKSLLFTDPLRKIWKNGSYSNNLFHLFSTYCAPGLMLSVFIFLASLEPHYNPLRQVLISPFCRGSGGLQCAQGHGASMGRH